MTDPEQHHPNWVSSDAIRKNDVLLGRGSGPNSRPGNILFRKFLKERKEEYNSTKNRATKAMIAQEIVDDMQKRHKTRFLRKATVEEEILFNIPNNVDAWCVVDQDSVLEKVKQGLRQKLEWKNMEDECEEEKASQSVDFSSEWESHSQQDGNHSASVQAAPREMIARQAGLASNEEEMMLMNLPLPPSDGHVSSDLPPPEPYQGPIVPREWRSNESPDL